MHRVIGNEDWLKDLLIALDDTQCMAMITFDIGLAGILRVEHGQFFVYFYSHEREEGG